MKIRDYFLVMACVTLWGLTFPVIKGVSAFVPGVFLAACRFLVIGLVAIFVPFPNVGKGRYISYSLLFGCGQYLLSTLSIYYGLSAGVAAVIMQIQVFITIGLAHVVLGEKVAVAQLVGVCIGFIGLAAFLFFNTYFGVSMPGLVLACIASCAWAGVNMIVKTSALSSFTALVAWGAVPNVPILFGLSWVLGDFKKIDFSSGQWLGFIASLLFLGLVVTFGVSILWNGLIKRHDAIHVLPFSLFIPVVGLTSSWLFFADTNARQFAPVLLIFVGIAVVLYSNLRVLSR